MNTEKIIPIAERAFYGLIDAWFGYDTPMYYSPSVASFNQIQYHKVAFPPLSNEVPSLQTNWFIFSQSSRPEIGRNEILNCDCFEISLSEKKFDDISEFCRSQKEVVYFALALVRSNNLSGITLLPATEQFDWYVIDLTQYFNKEIFLQSKKIFVPTHNYLNLATFSLIWSAQWVQAFHSVLYNNQIIQNVHLNYQANAIFRRQTGVDYVQLVKEQQKFITNTLPKVKNEIEGQLFNQLVSRIGLGVALNDIISQMLEKGEIDIIENYCPEALFGTANMWLFSRAYHNFMSISASVTDPFKNLRLLPFFSSRTEQTPTILKSVIWHVLLYYRYLKVDVKIVQAPNEKLEPGRDRSYYGGGIGFFPWLIISEESLKFDKHQNTIADAKQNLEFLTWLSKEAIITRDSSVSEVANLLLVIKDSAQLELHPRKPKLLFPPEDSYLEHPNLLWMYY